MAISVIFSSVYLYSSYQKKHNEFLNGASTKLILQVMPTFSIENLDEQMSQISNESIWQNETNYLYIHFWATWCAPCLEEMPSLLSYAKSLESSSDRRFLLIAAQNEKKDVLKFIKKLGVKIPSNVVMGLDPSSETMLKFGTIKVPETYLFDRNRHPLRKLIGQQRWWDRAFTSKL